jgi:hypothetical protein
VGAFVAIVLSITLKEAPKGTLKILAWIGFALTIGCLAACWLVWLHLGPPEPGKQAPESPWWQDVWETLYISAMILLVATISVTALSLKEDKPTWFWVLVAVPVLALIVVAVYVFWWR